MLTKIKPYDNDFVTFIVCNDIAVIRYPSYSLDTLTSLKGLINVKIVNIFLNKIKIHKREKEVKVFNICISFVLNSID